MKKMIETHLMPAPWAGLGLILFLVLGIGKVKNQNSTPIPGEETEIHYSNITNDDGALSQ